MDLLLCWTDDFPLWLDWCALVADIPLPAARNRKRKVRPDEESSDSDDEKGGGGGRRKGGSKGDSSKGLRHLTRQVCDKVKSKRTTTYREVANELVSEAMGPGGGGANEDGGNASSESKTVRRRVYDALNVLMAMGIIVREKKEIRWIGLPNAREELESLQKDKAQREERVAQKREQLKELEAQRKLYRNLSSRNIQMEQIQMHQRQQALLQQQHLEHASGGVLDPSLLQAPLLGNGIAEKIALPFLIVHTKAGTDISCEMTDDRTQYTFNFSKPFEIHQEIEIIKDMALPESHLDDESIWALSHSLAAAQSQPPIAKRQPIENYIHTEGHFTRSQAQHTQGIHR